MALEGQLSDFGLAEIFQLISGQQKSGFLTLEARQEMVFVFDKGLLISTRDRRSEGLDWLEKHLRDYGYFDDEQWRHIEFVRSNASLDLTEILLSEGLVEQEELTRILAAVAQELTFEGMKLSRGRYYFAPTRNSPEGIRARVSLDVQGLLMEAARRLDEEPRLAEFFPSPLVTFAAGPRAVERDELPPRDARLLRLALKGEPLGRIVRQARTDGFTARERLKEMCEEGHLRLVMPEGDADPGETGPGGRQSARRAGALRAPLPTTLAVLALLGVGCLRWLPVLGLAVGPVAPGIPGGPAGDAAAASRSAAPASALTSWVGFQAWFSPLERPDAEAIADLRLNQIREDVAAALELHRLAHGRYPDDLAQLVTEGVLERRRYGMLVEHGWRYRVLPQGTGYSLST